MPSEQPNEERGNKSRPKNHEPVWTFRGYELEASQFTTSMVHFFRAEIARANVWRQRLDATTNWAVITTGAAISVAFGSALLEQGHSIIILNTLLILLFLLIEARRYRYYELWSYRVRLMETDFFAAMLVPPFQPAPDWAETLAEHLLRPRYPISMWEAFGRRFRRNYLWLYVVLGLAWFLNLGLRPVAATSWMQLVNRAAIGAVPGIVVLLIGTFFYGVLMIVGLLTRSLHEATGEVLPRYGDRGEQSMQAVKAGREAPDKRRAWFRPSRRREQLLTFIVTEHPEATAGRIIEEMHRGVTRLEGIGMYSEQPRPVLMCALTVTEVARLKALVRAEDPKAFVVVSPAQEVLGGGFVPLDK